MGEKENHQRLRAVDCLVGEGTLDNRKARRRGEQGRTPGQNPGVRD